MKLFKNQSLRSILLMSVSALALVASFFFAQALPFDPAWVAIALCGLPILKDAAVGLFTRLDIKADVLVSLALIASVAIGELFAGGEVALIMALGSWLEEHTVAKARSGLERLANLVPTTARVLRAGREEIKPAEQVQEGECLRILAGETVPADGVITSGQTSIDQSTMTGESLPVDKAEGDEVLSGTVNHYGAFDMLATRAGQDSSLQRMVRLAQSADAEKAKIVRLADRWATWIVVVALLAAALTWALTGEIIRAVTVLVVFCPCALVLATPTAIMAGIGNLTNHGALVREGDALERLAKVRRVAFDKTGTLTTGQLRVAKTVSCLNGLTAEDLLLLAAAAESRSEHPLGKAVCAATPGADIPASESFELLPGRGVSAMVEGAQVLVGNETLFGERAVSLPAQLAESCKVERLAGHTVVYVAKDDQAAGLIALADTLRPEAAELVAEIHAAGLATVLLTGDNALAAQRVANAAGITELEADCLPENKLILIRRFEQQNQPVCMVGDGINDAPALKAAFVGVAMGGVGSDITIEAADVALVSDDIKELPHLLRLARRSMRTIHINLSASLLLNFVAIILAITGILNPVSGALVHNLGSVAVILNSSLLLKWRR